MVKTKIVHNIDWIKTWDNYVTSPVVFFDPGKRNDDAVNLSIAAVQMIIATEYPDAKEEEEKDKVLPLNRIAEKAENEITNKFLVNHSYHERVQIMDHIKRTICYAVSYDWLANPLDYMIQTYGNKDLLNFIAYK